MTDSARDDCGSSDRNSTERNNRRDVQERRAQRARHRVSAWRRFRKLTQSRRWSRRLARRGRSDDAQILKAIGLTFAASAFNSREEVVNGMSLGIDCTLQF